MNIAWIGTGVMGGSMMMHLHQAGHTVYAYNRSQEKLLPYMAQGVIGCDTITKCVEHADIVITMVGYPSDVEEVYTGEHGIFEQVKAGCICIDMTTSSPSLAKQLYKLGKSKGIQVLDAPVSGGDSGAKAGCLSIMVGGEETTFHKMKAVFECLGTPQWMGEAGCGQHTKACNQICVAGATAAMSEAIHYARKNHLDEAKMIQTIAKGAAGSWQINNTAPRVLANDFEPGFYIKHFIKDMHIVQDAMQGEHLEVLDRVCKVYEELANLGYLEKGSQAFIKYYEREE